MVRLYDYLPSGNGYKIRLLLTWLGIPFERIELDILKGETRTPEFLAINPNGRIPAVLFDDGRVLAESNAILWYFAEGTEFLPAEAWSRAKVLQWMCFEQYSHEPNVATLRHWLTKLARGGDAAWSDRIAEKRAGGNAALTVMERHLATHKFMVGEALSIADIALYAYTHVADEAEFDLAAYPAVTTWLDRVRARPGYIPITQGPITQG